MMTTDCNMAPPKIMDSTPTPTTLSMFDLPPLEFSFENVHTFLNTHSKRDKLGKVVHYGSRGMGGLCGTLLNFCNQESMFAMFLLTAQSKFKNVFVRVMNARRTVRWLSGTGLALGIMRNQVSLRVKAIKALLLTWILSDHYRWLQQLTILPGDQALTRNYGFSFACFSWALATYHHTAVLMASQPKENETKDETAQRVAKDNKTKRQILRNALGTVSAAHISTLWVSSEAICGFFGSFVAAIDMYDLVPRLQK